MTEPTVLIRQTEPWDIERLVPRTIDALEVVSATGRDFMEVLQESVEMSGENCWTALTEIDGVFQVVCIFGITHRAETPMVGIPWLLASDHVYSIKRYFIEHSKPWLERMQGNYTVLTNLVHADNKAAIRWLKWLGFSFSDKTYLLSDQPFLHFYKYANV